MVKALLLAIAPALAAGAHAECGKVLADERPAARRTLTETDLIELREIGKLSVPTYSGEGPFGVSPDGAQIAYVITRGDIASNSVCRTLVVSSALRPGRPRVLDTGGEPMFVTDPRYGYELPTGSPDIAPPLWSPDGARVAYRRRDAGVTRAWIAEADGSGARAISGQHGDVHAIAWSADGARLLYAVRANEAEARAAVDAEGRSGWLYDTRVSPDRSARPAPPAIAQLAVYAADVRSGRIAAADEAEAALIAQPGPPVYPAPVAASGPDGARAWAQAETRSPLSRFYVMVRLAGGREVRCAVDLCRGDILGLWWLHDRVLILRRSGRNNEETSLAVWRPGGGGPRLLLRTLDALNGCARAGSRLVCTAESSTQPRRLIAIETATGRRTVLYDPNPGFGRFALGQVVRLRWRNSFGLPCWGDLVLPPGRRRGPLPLVVVQYRSRGFLRGGTGDEYPIFLLAQRGMAVLSIERPDFVAATRPGIDSWQEVHLANQANWAERRSLLSAVLTGVDRVVASGIADRRRLGITGVSDGAATVVFALINAPVFAAAAIGSCCLDPVMTMATGGIAYADTLRGLGYPPLSADDPEFWRPMSIARNAQRIGTPLLMQLADSEFRLALEAFSALREQGKPVEMYVFPDEYHSKWQPAHRLAVYRRNLDWFAFWLQAREDPDPAKRAQYQRWRAMALRNSRGS
jgi:dipeptidyl aminopeptidase/acylaminoacyl peptidase